MRREERRGELLAAVDLAERGLAEYPSNVALKHLAVLTLARAGATGEAVRRFADYRLAAIDDEDIAALRARLAKDSALSEHRSTRRRRAARAAELYGAVFQRTGGYYPAINAATMWLIAGDAQRSRELASTVLGLLAANDGESYWAAATAAEAMLLLGRSAGARGAIEQAAARHGGDYGALASTRRQLRLICEALALDAEMLRPLAGPGVAVFCGHRIGGPEKRGALPPEAEPRVAAGIARALERHSPRYGYGALAGGADILWAEGLLARGGELHVVLPFARAEFLELSVASCGPGWSERFARCLAAATTVRYATDDAYLGDEVLFRYGAELAMGLALLRARYLDADVRQLALWDGEPARGGAGTALDVAAWQHAGRSTTVVTPAGELLPDHALPADGATQSRAPEVSAASPGTGRVVRAILFGDFREFSKLGDEQAVRFAGRVLGAVARVIDRYQDQVLFRNTWGDGLSLVLTDAVAAAALALDLQDAVAAIDLESEGLPSHLALRLGGHLGPVSPVHDPVLLRDRFTGSHVTRTARIEPVTPPGEVYVTEPLAAALVFAGNREMTCDYVGHMAAAKDYGRLGMYRLRRTHSGDEPAP